MPTYLSPGVYVDEKASGSAPIVGAGTSTAAFIGIYKQEDTRPLARIILLMPKCDLEYVI